MGYRIVYDGREGKYEVRRCNQDRIFVLIGLLFLLIFALWQDGASYIRDALIPGDNRVTMSALRNLTEELRQGTDLQDAVVTFCGDVIHGSVPEY